MPSTQPQKPSQETSFFFAHMIYALGTGAIMGMALTKSQAFRPDIIKGQLTMENFTMLKVFLSAAGTSILGLQIMIEKKWISLPPFDHPFWARNILGGAILGIGMYIAGACPGTVLAQVGMRVNTAIFTLIGGLIGALTFGILQPYFLSLLPRNATSSQATVDAITSTSRRYAALGLAAGFGGVLLVLENFRPWQVDVGLPLNISSMESIKLLSPVWSPYISGVIIGLLQFPVFLISSDGLGCSSGFVVLLSKIFGTNLADRFSYFKLNFGARTTWQLFLDAGIILGAGLCYLAAAPSKSVDPTLGQALTSLIGGFALIFGARLANGCTSGHGLTGVAKLSVGSLLAVAAMFGGGMATAFFVR